MKERKENRQEEDLRPAEGCGFSLLVGLAFWVWLIRGIIYLVDRF